MNRRPAESEYAPSYAAYVGKVSDSTDILATLEGQRGQLAALPHNVTGDLETHRYAEGKWSVREVIGHVCDAERVFGYRIFCMSRGDTQSLPGFDENVYAERSGSHQRPIADLVAELVLLRDANLSLLRNLDAEAWSRTGDEVRRRRCQGHRGQNSGHDAEGCTKLEANECPDQSRQRRPRRFIHAATLRPSGSAPAARRCCTAARSSGLRFWLSLSLVITSSISIVKATMARAKRWIPSALGSTT